MLARLVFNPRAGSRERDAEELIAHLRAVGIDVLYTPKRGADAIAQWAREPIDLIVAAGGDGTVARAARALVHRSPALAIVPLGTANNIGRTLGLTGDISQAVLGLKNPRRRRLDLGLAKGPWGERIFVEACGLGLFQHALEHDASSKDKHLDRARHLLLRKLESGHGPTTWDLDIDGVHRTEDLLLLEVMLMGSIGPRLRLAPAADPFDGLFDVVLAPATSRARLIRYLEALLAGDEGATPDLEVIQARRLSMHIVGTSVCVDDRVVHPHLAAPPEARFEVLPGAIELWLPPRLARPTRTRPQAVVRQRLAR